MMIESKVSECPKILELSPTRYYEKPLWFGKATRLINQGLWVRSGASLLDESGFHMTLAVGGTLLHQPLESTSPSEPVITGA